MFFLYLTFRNRSYFIDALSIIRTDLSFGTTFTVTFSSAPFVNSIWNSDLSRT